jgi:hypothetical protein
MSRIAHQRPLRTYEELGAFRCRVYYGVLNDSSDFPPALRELDTFVRPYGGLSHLSRTVSDAVLPVFHEFARRWGLPTVPAQFPNGGRGSMPYGLDDLMWRYYAGVPDDHASGGLPYLTVGARPDPRGHLWELTKPYEHKDGRYDADVIPPTITPKTPEAFVYDPIAWPGSPGAMTPAGLQQRAAALAEVVRTDILLQAEALRDKAKRLGAGTASPRYRREGVAELSALRLYRRAAKGMTYDDIAAAEDAETASGRRTIDTSTVRKTVTEWARWLGVVLPED